MLVKCHKQPIKVYNAIRINDSEHKKLVFLSSLNICFPDFPLAQHAPVMSTDRPGPAGGSARVLLRN